MVKHWWTRALLGRTAVSNPLHDDENPSPQFEGQWRDLVKQRLLIIVALLGLWVVGLEGRLVWVQVLHHQDWQDQADVQQAHNEPIDAARGDILDRDGRLFGGSVGTIEVHIDLDELSKTSDKTRKALKIADSASLARQLCAALGDCAPGEQAAIVAKLDRPKAVDALIRRAKQMPPDAVAGLKTLIESFEKVLKTQQGIITYKRIDLRFYPNVTLASQVIGYASPFDKNGKERTTVGGVVGVEARFDQQLRGVPGKQFAQRDGFSRDMLTTVITPPKPGMSLELTISSPIQEIAERALERGVREAGALGGCAIVLDSMTGGVFAMASAPGYDLNNPATGKDAYANRCVQHIYEPGSTFKIVTLAGALNEGVANTHTFYDTHGGRLMVPGRPTPIKEDKGHNYGTLDVQGILVHSSNVGAAIVGLQMGSDLMVKYAKLFGFTARPSLDQFFGETPGVLRVPAKGLPANSLATVAFGYGVQGNPLQMAAAVNVFATGGLLLRPHLINATIENGIRKTQDPEVVARVVSPETAATMTSMLEAVVTDGTGAPAALKRFQVAGKTGTTHKFVDGKYSDTDYLVSFIGFVPSRHPKFTIVVVVDRPTTKSAYGGAVAAPIFKQIAEESLQYVGEIPSIDPAPPVVLPETRVPTKPAAPRPADTPPVYVNTNGAPTVPDFTGLTLREALKRVPPGMTLDARGDGVVVSQSPAAGEPITSTRLTLRLERGGRQ